jgi:hypothetical protein
VAALVKAETGLEPALVVGGRGEFTVWVGEEVVAKKHASGFPADDEVVRAVRLALSASPGL